jgi:hypothetical protein
MFFDIHVAVSAASERGYHMTAESVHLPSRADALMPLDEGLQLIEQALRLADVRVSRADTMRTGGLLFDALLRDRLREAYRAVQGAATDRRAANRADHRDGTEAEEVYVRLLLRIQPRELHALPWECLFDPWRQGFVSFSDSDWPATLIVRDAGGEGPDRHWPAGPAERAPTGTGQPGYCTLWLPWHPQQECRTSRRSANLT